MVSQHAGATHSRGNAEAVFECWSGLRRWIEDLRHGTINVNVDEYFFQLFDLNTMKREIEYADLVVDGRG